MKVLHVLDHSIPYVDGYTIRSRHIVHKQKELGIHPVVMTSPLHRTLWDRNPELIDAVHYHRISSENFINYPFCREIQIIARITRAILRQYREDKFDLIHAHSPSLNGFSAMLASKMIGVPYIYEVRALWEDAAIDQKKFSKRSMRYKISRYVETAVFKQADAVTTIASYLMQDIYERGISFNKLHHIPNGVDTDLFSPINKNATLLKSYGIDPDNNYVLGFIGSLYKFEGLDVLLDAMKKLTRLRKDVYLMVVGGGEEEAAIRQRIQNESIENTIMVGRVPYDQVNQYYSIMDIMIYPRLSERITELTTPLKPLEAMAMEKAIIGSDVGGIRELIQDGQNGYLFQAHSANDLVDRVVKLIESKTIQRLGKNARQYVVSEKEWIKIVSQYIPVYKSVL